MDFTNISKSTPIEPEIELDGGFAYCVRCKTELEPSNTRCPYCNQTQDWSWLKRGDKNE